MYNPKRFYGSIYRPNTVYMSYPQAIQEFKRDSKAPKVAELLADHLNEQCEPERVLSDHNLTFKDVDPLSSDSELGDLWDDSNGND